MKYIDSGSREEDQTLAHWLAEQLGQNVSHLRIQSGFFGRGTLGLLEDVLTNEDVEVVIVIGSNRSATTRGDVEALFELMKMPRPNARLGVVSYGNGFYHPKVYHIRRSDGSQCAYVGSSNLTPAGLSTHVEAGLTLDTREGDDQDLLREIVSATEDWFTEDRAGFHAVDSRGKIESLEAEEILSDSQEQTAEQGDQSGTGGSEEGDSLHRLNTLPSPPSSTQESATSAEPDPSATDTTTQAGGVGNEATPRDGFPGYLFFKPNAEKGSTTTGRDALTGAGLPNGTSGFIMRLNKDTARYFPGGKGEGTANISIGTNVAHVFRFGIYHGKPRPAAKFELQIRFLPQSDNSSIVFPSDEVNLLGYGYLPDEDSHPDIRLTVPTKRLRDDLMPAINAQGAQAPTDGDYALLEFPSSDDPFFRLSFLEPSSSLHQEAMSKFEAAAQGGEKVHSGACWLPDDLSPEW